MKISHKKDRSPISIIIVTLIILLLGVFLIVFPSSISKENSKKTNIDDIEIPTRVYRGYSYAEIIKEEINQVHEDSIISIHFNSELGKPFLLYVYKGSIDQEQIADKFFLHIHLKDNKTLKSTTGRNFINLDFFGKPIELSIDNKKHFVFKRYLTHEFFDIPNVKHFNTGRFNKKGVSLNISNIKIDSVVPVNVANHLEKLTISIREKDFRKIELKRNEALKKGVLITSDKDLIKAKISCDKLVEENSEIRLKGDWTDHLEDPKKWSFRIALDGMATLQGQRKFSVQHPKVRNYLWEWMFNKAVKQNDLVGLRYDFVDVDLKLTNKKQVVKTIPLGIMAIEESFDKLLIESNRRREGLLLGFDESLIWKDREDQLKLNLPDESRSDRLQTISNAPIRVHNQNRVLSDATLSNQFEIAKNLLEGLRNGKLKISEVFDLDKLTTFVALSNLFGGKHGFVLHNFRVYYNPITNKFEPVSFDSNSGERISEIIQYPFSAGDDSYAERLVEKLGMVSSSEFVNNLLTKCFDELSELEMYMADEFDENFDLSVLEHNSNVIKKKINPSRAVVASMVDLNNRWLDLEIKNLSDFPITINGLEHVKGKRLNVRNTNEVIYSNENKKIRFTLKESFVNAFVSKKNKKGEFRYPKDVEKLVVKYNILGRSTKNKANIIPYSKSKDLSNRIVEYKNLFRSTMDNIGFAQIDEELKEVKFISGNYQANSTLLIPPGYQVIIEKGFTLDLINNASLISYSSLICNGTKESPIRFYSSDSTGAGIFVSNTNKKSKLRYTYFSNLANPKTNTWNLTGAVNFHEADVEISNSVFEKNRCEDGLNIIRSTFLVESSLFENTFSDAFDGDFVKGRLVGSRFINAGNDCIDISGSEIYLNDIEIINPSDKGISAGEASFIEGSNIRLNGGEIGIVSKDLSKISLDEVSISNTRLGFSAFQKKSEFGNGIIEITNLTLSNNGLDYLIENSSSLTIDNNPVTTVSTNVIDQMYGNEYGKSSK